VCNGAFGMSKLPFAHPAAGRIIVLDTETTGLTQNDRLITLGAVSLEDGELVSQRTLYLIFDPMTKSNPFAERVHGFDEWTLRHQDMFGSYARKVRDWLGWADTLVMHNASFDMRFLQGEMQRAGLPAITTPHYCTMKAAREMWPLDSVRLDRCLEHCGIERRGVRHGALEDAMLTAAIFLRQQDIEFRLPDISRLPPPRNFRSPPPPPGQFFANPDAPQA
jgi:DNA polymerase-3 subunit epsilon